MQRGNCYRLCDVSVLCEGVVLSLCKGQGVGSGWRWHDLCGRALQLRSSSSCGTMGMHGRIGIRFAMPVPILAVSRLPIPMCGSVREAFEAKRLQVPKYGKQSGRG